MVATAELSTESSAMPLCVLTTICCHHQFCSTCLAECARRNERCPLCRSIAHPCRSRDESCALCIAQIPTAATVEVKRASEAAAASERPQAVQSRAEAQASEERARVLDRVFWMNMRLSLVYAFAWAWGIMHVVPFYNWRVSPIALGLLVAFVAGIATGAFLFFGDSQGCRVAHHLIAMCWMTIGIVLLI